MLIHTRIENITFIFSHDIFINNFKVGTHMKDKSIFIFQ